MAATERDLLEIARLKSLEDKNDADLKTAMARSAVDEAIFRSKRLAKLKADEEADLIFAMQVSLDSNKAESDRRAPKLAAAAMATAAASAASSVCSRAASASSVVGTAPAANSTSSRAVLVTFTAAGAAAAGSASGLAAVAVQSPTAASKAVSDSTQKGAKEARDARDKKSEIELDVDIINQHIQQDHEYLRAFLAKPLAQQIPFLARLHVELRKFCNAPSQEAERELQENTGISASLLHEAISTLRNRLMTMQRM